MSTNFVFPSLFMEIVTMTMIIMMMMMMKKKMIILIFNIPINKVVT